jgi:hypothetical protein
LELKQRRQMLCYIYETATKKKDGGVTLVERWQVLSRQRQVPSCDIIEVLPSADSPSAYCAFRLTANAQVRCMRLMAETTELVNALLEASQVDKSFAYGIFPHLSRPDTYARLLTSQPLIAIVMSAVYSSFVLRTAVAGHIIWQLMNIVGCDVRDEMPFDCMSADAKQTCSWRLRDELKREGWTEILSSVLGVQSCPSDCTLDGATRPDRQEIDDGIWPAPSRRRRTQLKPLILSAMSLPPSAVSAALSRSNQSEQGLALSSTVQATETSHLPISEPLDAERESPRSLTRTLKVLHFKRDQNKTLAACSKKSSDGKGFTVPCLEELEKFRIIVAMCILTSLPLALGAQCGHYSHTFIDEAGQALEPKAMIGIRGMALTSTNIILSGDPKQLGPIVRFRIATRCGIATSYLDRLMARDISNLDTAGNGVTTVKLFQNFRNYGSILSFPNRLFYRGELEVYGDPLTINALARFNHLRSPNFSVIFHAVTSSIFTRTLEQSLLDAASIQGQPNPLDSLCLDSLRSARANPVATGPSVLVISGENLESEVALPDIAALPDALVEAVRDAHKRLGVASAGPTRQIEPAKVLWLSAVLSGLYLARISALRVPKKDRAASYSLPVQQVHSNSGGSGFAKRLSSRLRDLPTLASLSRCRLVHSYTSNPTNMVAEKKPIFTVKAPVSKITAAKKTSTPKEITAPVNEDKNKHKEIAILNSFTNNIFEHIASEVSKLAPYSKKSTISISSRYVQNSVQLIPHREPDTAYHEVAQLGHNGCPGQISRNISSLST